MPKLSRRLQAVADLVPDGIHADIGSDHGYLLKSLARTGKIRGGIAIENKHAPFKNSRRNLTEPDVEVRLADGLEGLAPGEADSLSFCGMGGELIAKLLARHPDRVPRILIVQPNRSPEFVRRWALENGYHVAHEKLVRDGQRFVVMSFKKTGSTDDPAYETIDFESGLLFGPLLLKEQSPDLIESIREEHAYLNQLDRRNGESQRRLDALTRVLGTFK